MPQLDSITPNPKQPPRKPTTSPRGVAPLPPAEIERRRKVMWGGVAVFIVVILIVWFATLGSRLRGTGDNTAWNTLVRKLGDVFTSARQAGNGALRNIDINAPTSQEIHTIQQQVFPDASAVTGTTNANVNASTNQNSNVNSAANQNTNAY